MKKRSEFFIYIVVALGMAMTQACVKNSVSSTPPSSATTISSISYTYKWYDTTNTGTSGQKIVYGESTLNNTVVVSNDTVYCSPTIPSSMSIDQIPNVITRKSLTASATISDQARISPVGKAPIFGTVGDYSIPQSYVVTAASGAQKTYVIVTNAIPQPKINKYMGTYAETGYFTHPTLPRALNLTKVLSYVDPNTVSCDLADLGSSGYTMTIKVNTDNTCEVSQFLSGSPLANSQMVPGATNQYYPTTNTFILNYQYLGGSGWRIITDTLRKQ